MGVGRRGERREGRGVCLDASWDLHSGMWQSGRRRGGIITATTRPSLTVGTWMHLDFGVGKRPAIARPVDPD